MSWDVRMTLRGSGGHAGARRPAREDVAQVNVDVLRWIHAGSCLSKVAILVWNASVRMQTFRKLEVQKQTDFAPTSVYA
jgi:hypothetical protein